MGHNYGLAYPAAPWGRDVGDGRFTLVTGYFLGWRRCARGSVWPAVIGHAAINGISGLGVLFVQGQPNPLLGPLLYEQPELLAGLAKPARNSATERIAGDDHDRQACGSLCAAGHI